MNKLNWNFFSSHNHPKVADYVCSMPVSLQTHYSLPVFSYYHPYYVEY